MHWYRQHKEHGQYSDGNERIAPAIGRDLLCLRRLFARFPRPRQVTGLFYQVGSASRRLTSVFANFLGGIRASKSASNLT